MALDEDDADGRWRRGDDPAACLLQPRAGEIAFDGVRATGRLCLRPEPGASDQAARRIGPGEVGVPPVLRVPGHHHGAPLTTGVPGQAPLVSVAPRVAGRASPNVHPPILFDGDGERRGAQFGRSATSGSAGGEELVDALVGQTK